jgi:hypothetical protein
VTLGYVNVIELLVLDDVIVPIEGKVPALVACVLVLVQVTETVPIKTDKVYEVPGERPVHVKVALVLVLLMGLVLLLFASTA